ncbi:hypothetical protein PHJA_002361000 [Phtheirospermum japonicum]|uniref:S-protein homolog n=1 Tax=Phtheirospermum japonicum TaxID=374723 RepID=A0A830CQI3_9LAMI|nr:hypothetical protein PHJA_002361000 [Phtheirospermum japonicum]
MLNPSSQQTNDETLIKVVIKNDIPAQTIKIHCYSYMKVDLGVHELSYGANFTFEFRTIIPPVTKYGCEFITSYGYGNYEVFSNYLEAYECHEYCLWSVQAGGPCLQTFDKGEVDCKSWK